MPTTYVPTFLKGTEIFRVMPGSYYNHPQHKHKIDENGCLPARHFTMYSNPQVWRPEIAKGLLVDVTHETAEQRAQERKDTKAAVKKTVRGIMADAAAQRAQGVADTEKAAQDKIDAGRVKQSARIERLRGEMAVKKTANDAALVSEGQQIALSGLKEPLSDRPTRTVKSPAVLPEIDLDETPVGTPIEPKPKRKPGRKKKKSSRKPK